MSESKRVMGALAACLGVGLLLSGCGQVVGADCANEGDYCGSVCCPSEYTCENEVCLLPDGGPSGDGGTCGLGSLLCGTLCIDPMTNDDHCGGCGGTCNAGLSCALGACVDSCSAEQIFCTGDCVNPLDDNNHCGNCTTECGDGFGCQAGLCVSECAADEAYCDGGCRLIGSDDEHCGACGNLCAGNFDCRLGTCVPEPCDIGMAACGDTCRQLDSDAANCGGCGNVCDAGDVCDGGVCADVCSLPRLVCDDRCVNPLTHPEHCGSCDTVCDSRICRNGACQDEGFGHLVLIGHDYTSSVVGMNRLVGTAALISLDHDIALLAFEGDSEAASIDGVHAALDEVAGATGRDIDYNGESIVARVPDRLLGSDVFLIHAQHGASNDELLNLGFLWRSSLRSFLRRGGVLIVLDAGGANSGTHLLLEAAGLISVTTRQALPVDAPLRVIDGADAVSRGVPVQYLAETRSSAFHLRSTAGWVVATDDAVGLPVVIHTVISP